MGSAAIELVISMMQANQFGLPTFPRLVAIQGKWSAGPSFPLLGSGFSPGI
jgi:hypothetical protein